MQILRSGGTNLRFLSIQGSDSRKCDELDRRYLENCGAGGAKKTREKAALAFSSELGGRFRKHM